MHKLNLNEACQPIEGGANHSNRVSFISLDPLNKYIPSSPNHCKTLEMPSCFAEAVA